ncbi:ATP-binding protein [Catenulispora yoronensis]
MIGGHGLYIVAKLTDRWGVEQLAEGKKVWVEFDAARFAAG